MDWAGSAAQRSYPIPKVRGGERERQAATAQERPRGTTPRLRSGWRLKELPTSEVGGGGREEQPHIQGTVAARAQEDGRGYSTFKVRRDDLSKVRSSGCALLEHP